MPEPLRKDLAVDALIASHLPQLECCKDIRSSRLRRVAVEAISLMDEAGRLSSLAPERHHACLDPGGRENPQPEKKRVSVEQFYDRCNETAKPGFRYVAPLGSTDTAQNDPSVKRFFEKLRRGGLADQADTMRARTLSAESVLLDFATRPEGTRDLDHLRQLVRAECDDAMALTQSNTEIFGPEMYRHLLTRMEFLSMKDSSTVLSQRKEVLLGIAGMLTQECTVWWGPKFVFDRSSQ
jgi:hypothetical protein